MNRLFIITLSVLFGPLLLWGQVKLLTPSGTLGWSDPVYSHDGSKICFTDASAKQIRLFERDEDSTRFVAEGAKIGKRFVFEPDDRRLVFRMTLPSLPGRPVRLYSVSLYLYDPVGRTTNEEGDLFGPYYFDHKVWYRFSLLGPYFDYQSAAHKAGPYMDLPSGQLWVINQSGDTVFSSAAGQHFIGAEISPDGEWVAAVQDQPAIRTEVIHIRDGKSFTIDGGAAPGWSGDSKRLVCVRTNSSAAQELYLLDVGTANGRVILTSPEYQPETPALNPDGSRVVFISRGALYELKIPL
jgi:Tol biopolymer transport system component